MSFETQANQTFWRDIPGFCRDIPEVPEKFEKKKFVFNFRSLEKGGFRSESDLNRGLNHIQKRGSDAVATEGAGLAGMAL